jgi:ubiquinone/menaquinone biosynthesis C-methylase UbiE/glycosyltransferase involved in cell wall biosynthesis
VSIDSEQESQLPWTGERYLPELTGEIQLEHVHRYLVAREYAEDKDVLDIACGEGFGSAILAESARSVVGVDIAMEAVKHAAIRYRLDNVNFRQGSCAAIPLDDNSIDLVVSFETIEHHDEHKAMMREVKRVLRPEGVLIISSPDKKEYAVIPNYRNPFHVRELFKEEFEDLVQAHFKNLALVSQRIVYGSGILPQTGAFRITDYDIKNTGSACACGGLARPRYLIAVASDEALPVLSGGLLEQTIEESEIVKNYIAENARRSELIAQLEGNVLQAQEQLCQVQEQCRLGEEQLAQVQEQRRQDQEQRRLDQEQLRQVQEQLRQVQEQHRLGLEQVGRLDEQLLAQSSQSELKVRALEEQIEQLNLALREAERLRHSMSRSLSWRSTWPLRVVRDVGARTLNKVKRNESPRLEKAPERSEATNRVDSVPTKPELDPLVAHFLGLIRVSDLFDASAYGGAEEACAHGLEPALHYVLEGERRGLRPSMGFDPSYYGGRYPDVAAWGGNRLGHYLEWGRAQGRRALPVADTLAFPSHGLSPDRPTILVLIHEASRTGAPILGWNIARGLRHQANVVVILLREGPLQNAFAEIAAAVVGPLGNDIFDPLELLKLARRLAENYRPAYVIANSVETRALVPALEDEGIPVVTLVHEFSGYTKPAGILQSVYERAAEIVFPAEIVRHSSEIDYPFLRLRRTHVLPQGPSEVPRSNMPTDDSKQTEVECRIRSQLRPEGSANDLVVVGMGFVDWRKGVDLFIATATAVLAREVEAPVRFVWIGHGYRVADTLDVSVYLSEQVARSHLGNRFGFMDAVEDVESIYKEADVLFLSSRLDPLPNVAIDSVLRGIPVICFAEASGMAEILASNAETGELVVPHLDVGAAAALIGSLAADSDKLRRIGDAVRELGRARFNMKTYINALDDLGRRARQIAEQESADAAVILAAGDFDPPLYLGARAPFVELSAAVRQYSGAAGKIDYARVPVSGAYTRRPLAGFNPLTYALQCPTYNRQEGRDPLAHYLKAGRPEGSWAHPVVRVEAAPLERTTRPPMAESAAFRVVLHGHFHYTDHLDDFLQALNANAHRCQLILTTDSTVKASAVKAAFNKSGLEPDIHVVPNRGRDIAPFLKVLGEVIGSCDLLGHIHGKRSLSTSNVDADFGDRWRAFLWQHLLGDEMPMLDIIMQAFAEDQALGLIFPEDPFLIGWEDNLDIAQSLAARMDLRAPLPPSIDFPVGTMFWARPKALAPLLRLGLNLDEYPDEPLPGDGTILHALERLLPLIAEDAGFHYATTYLPRFAR